MTAGVPTRVDVVVIGAGLAGLCLARQLQLASPSLTILHLEKRLTIPPAGQKVGEATVQVSGYYLSKVLELEEHLLREHLLKYNLRFHWKTPGRPNTRFEDYSQSYIRALSNIASYQLNRNVLEAELLRRNAAAPGYHLVTGVTGLSVETERDLVHRVRFSTRAMSTVVEARWVVDATGRGRLFRRTRALERTSPIRHGSSFVWVDGLVDVERLTDSTPREIRMNPARAATGHLPFWLATNHFCGEGYWVWVIPLRGRTSIGVVYDTDRVEPAAVATPQRLVAWICREFPLFERDLPTRRILHHGTMRSVASDCQRTIDASGWAVVGEAGRFSDPLYSPGGDLIAIYNTLVTDAIAGGGARDLAASSALYEQVMRAVYQAYVPGYARGYDALGDQETMSLKYVWELTIYFGFLVFPFINDLWLDERFAVSYLRAFASLGRINSGIQDLVSGYYRWRRDRGIAHDEPGFVDFMDCGALAAAERTFYRVGVDTDTARAVLQEQHENVRHLARFIAAYVYAVVAGSPSLIHNRQFVEGIDLDRLAFDPASMRAVARAAGDAHDLYEWPWDLTSMQHLLPSWTRTTRDVPAAEAIS